MIRLTHEQRSVIYWLCSIRSKIWRDANKILNNNEHPDYYYIVNLFPCNWAGHDGEINEKLKKVGLPPTDIPDLPRCHDYISEYVDEVIMKLNDYLCDFEIFAYDEGEIEDEE